MDSVYKQTGLGTSSAAESDEGANRLLLEGVARLCRSWVDRLAVEDPLRASAIRLRTLAEELVLNGQSTSEAMNTTQALLCVICRHLSASHGRCSGQALRRCLLLNEASP